MFMKRTMTLNLIGISLFGLSLSTFASEQNNRAILLTAIEGSYTVANPKPVKLLITTGAAKGCLAEGNAYLNKKRLRYEFNLAPINCIKNGQKISVGNIVRGQHNIKGTMANSGMGRDYLVSNKGVIVSLTHN